MQTIKLRIAEKIASAVAMMGVSSILAVGAAQSESVSLLGVKLTGVFAGAFSLLSLIFFIIKSSFRKNIYKILLPKPCLKRFR